MSNLPPPPPPPPPGRGAGGRGPTGPGQGGPTPPSSSGRRTPPGLPKWSIALLVVVVLGALAATQFWPSSSSEKLKYSEFLTQVENHKVESITIDNGSRSISGKYVGGGDFSTTADTQISDSDLAVFKEAGIQYTFKQPSSNWWA